MALGTQQVPQASLLEDWNWLGDSRCGQGLLQHTRACLTVQDLMVGDNRLVVAWQICAGGGKWAMPQLLLQQQ